MRTTTIAAAAALLFSLPAAAQQAQPADPHHPEGAAVGQAPSPAPDAAPRGSAGAQGMPWMGPGMMGGAAGMPMGEDRRPGMMMRRHGPPGAPMNVIINVGPDIRVDAAAEGGPRRMDMMGGGGMMGPGMMGGGMPMPGMPGGMGFAARLHDMLAERVEGALAFLHAELRIRPEQASAWDGFAAQIREAATRYREAVQARAPTPAPGAGLEQRLAAHEARLAAELERLRACRSAAATLLPALDDTQRRTVESLAWLILPGMAPAGPMAGMPATR